MSSNELYICTATDRFKGCILKKNFCCAYCHQLPECMRLFEKSRDKRKIKPCPVGMGDDCDLRDII